MPEIPQLPHAEGYFADVSEPFLPPPEPIGSPKLITESTDIDKTSNQLEILE